MATISRNSIRPQWLAYLLAVSIGCMLILAYVGWGMLWRNGPQNDLAYFVNRLIPLFVFAAVTSALLCAGAGKVTEAEVITAQLFLFIATLWASMWAMQSFGSPLLTGMFLVSGAGVNTGLRFVKDRNPEGATQSDMAAG